MSFLLGDLSSYFAGLGMVIPVFTDNMPDAPETATALYEYGGEIPSPQIASVNKSIQIVTRDRSQTAARNAANAYYNALVTEEGILNLTPERWCMIALRNTPLKMKVEKDLVYYCFNLGITTYSD